MGTSWRVTAWGVRGAFPRMEANFARYGGNTSCFSLERGDEALIFDAGSGLAALGEKLADRPRRLHLMLSHFHLDHLMGLASFRPLTVPGTEVHIYGEPGLQEWLDRLIGPPYWPVTVGGQAARTVFHPVEPGETFSPEPGLRASTLRGVHPGGSMLYRLDGDGRSVVYGLDCELAGDMARRLTDFAQGADLLIWDGCAAPGALRPGWGHATWEQGLTLGREAGVGMVWVTHYARDYDDDFLEKQERLAAKAGDLCRFAREGTVIEL